MNEWQDIATAPRDGTPVLCHSPGWMYAEVYVWNSEYGLWQEGCSMGDFVDMGWEPEYWLPLPPLPKATVSAPA